MRPLVVPLFSFCSLDDPPQLLRVCHANISGSNVDDLPLPFAPIYDLETFSTTFEDPFSYSEAVTGRPYELTPHNPEAFIHTTSPTAEGLDNKLLVGMFLLCPKQRLLIGLYCPIRSHCGQSCGPVVLSFVLSIASPFRH